MLLTSSTAAPNLLDHPICKLGALVMGAGELWGDKMETALDRTVFLGLLAHAPRGEEKAGAALAVGMAVPLAYATFAGRKRAMTAIGQHEEAQMPALVHQYF